MIIFVCSGWNRGSEKIGGRSVDRVSQVGSATGPRHGLLKTGRYGRRSQEAIFLYRCTSNLWVSAKFHFYIFLFDFFILFIKDYQIRDYFIDYIFVNHGPFSN